MGIRTTDVDEETVSGPDVYAHDSWLRICNDKLPRVRKPEAWLFLECGKQRGISNVEDDWLTVELPFDN